jgi:hypothetical protein
MKKTILALLFIGGSTAMFAQETTDTTKKPKTNIDSTKTWPADSMMQKNADVTTITTNDTLISSGDYNAYRALNIPTAVTRQFQTNYPNIPSARWSKSYNGDWRVMYKYNGQNMNMYYSPRGESYMVALPVLQNLVPEEVTNKAMELYGMNIYDVTRLKAVDSTMEVYQVRLLDNGQIRTEVISADGSAAPAGWNDLSKLNQGMEGNMNNLQLRDSSRMQQNKMVTDSTRMMRDTTMQMEKEDRNMMEDTSMHHMKDTSMMRDTSMMQDTSMHRMHHMQDTTKMHHMRDSSMMNDMNDIMKVKKWDSTDMNNANVTSDSATNKNNVMNAEMKNKAGKDIKAGEGTDVKIKSKSSDGKETKTKTKDGKTKVKGDY